MRYSSAVVLSTIAVGQAAAANLRHASFHSRRQAEQKRGDYDKVNWEAVSYDLSGVDWSSVFNTQKPTPTPTPANNYQPSTNEAQNTPTPTPAAYTPAPSSDKPAATSQEAPKPSQTGASDSDSDGLDDLVSDLMEGVESIVKSLGIVKAGVNSKTNNGGIWVGSDSEWKTSFINDASEDLVLFCWKADGFSGMSLNVNQPQLSVGLKKGQKVDVSFAAGVPGACAPAYSSTELALFGGLKQTWFEFTFGNNGAFDISRNVNMNGNNISAKGSKCTSDMNTCVFKCDSGDSCEKGYNLLNCGSGSGGGGGYDSVMQGVGGGCAMGADSESVTVTFT